IADHQADRRILVGLAPLEGLVAVVRLEDGIALLGEILAEERADVLLLLDEEHDAAGGRSRLRPGHESPFSCKAPASAGAELHITTGGGFGAEFQRTARGSGNSRGLDPTCRRACSRARASGGSREGWTRRACRCGRRRRRRTWSRTSRSGARRPSAGWPATSCRTGCRRPSRR